jgi:hypothetical protein
LSTYFEAYKVSNIKNDGNFTWELIGNGDPRLMKDKLIEPKIEKMVIREGDYIAVRCVFNNTLSHLVKLGTKDDDEMCNFFMIFSMDSKQSLYSINSCVVDPKITWFETFHSEPYFLK